MSNSLFQPVLKDNETATESRFGNRETGNDLILPEVLFITSYPPRVCGIATYSQDLITALNNKFSNSFSIRVCALETGDVSYDYPEEVKYTLDTSHSAPFLNLAKKINEDNHIQLILIQHEFGFYKNQEQAFLQLLYGLTKPAVVVFHTVLPNPDAQLKLEVKNIVATCQSIVVMTKHRLIY